MRDIRHYALILAGLLRCLVLAIETNSIRFVLVADNERSRYNRRKRDLWSVILAIRVSLQIVLDAAHASD